MELLRKAMDDAGLKLLIYIKFFLVEVQTRTPAVQDAVKKFIGKEPFKGINPDELRCCRRQLYRQVF